MSSASTNSSRVVGAVIDQTKRKPRFNTTRSSRHLPVAASAVSAGKIANATPCPTMPNGACI
jgi:hypothetical protein